MEQMMRLPAIPLVVNDPYFSIWCAADRLTDRNTTHWCGAVKQLRGNLRIDGTEYRFLADGGWAAMETVGLTVTPTMTKATYEAAGVRLLVRFITPALPDDLETLSTPITMLDFAIESIDGNTHAVALRFDASDALCYEGQIRPMMMGESYALDDLNVAFTGQVQQKPLSHSGDHITIDWGYLYLASPAEVRLGDGWLHMAWAGEVAQGEPAHTHALLGYDDTVSVLYYGTPCKAWYARNGRTMPEALTDFHTRYDAIIAACEALDARVHADAMAAAGEDYAYITAAAWRHTFGAHKLIATPEGKMSFLSKENDSNGCIGTVDVSYPSIPLFLKYCPELVNALCIHVLAFAAMPVWQEPFAPHDVGRYPIVGGQVYSSVVPSWQQATGAVYPPFYLYPATKKNVFNIRYQMPVEECGNMLVMLATAAEATGDLSLVQAYRPILDGWAQYLVENGEDPGDQLCTDDFAGHLARNINLAAKAMVGVACYARILKALGEDGSAWEKKAKAMADSWLARAQQEGHTALTFDGVGWSQKYNLVWDRILGLGLLPDAFYAQEVRSYLPRMNRYGLPLDSRAEYTKSDWIAWTSAMAPDRETMVEILKPLRIYLQETPSRVAFSDWYNAANGQYMSFIGRSVQGGLFMPMLRKDLR